MKTSLFGLTLAVSVMLLGSAILVAEETHAASRRSAASWYGSDFRGGFTGSNQNLRTVVRRSLPFGTRLRTTNGNNSRFVAMRIQDFIFHAPGRIVEISGGSLLRMVETSIVSVRSQQMRR